MSAEPIPQDPLELDGSTISVDDQQESVTTPPVFEPANPQAEDDKIEMPGKKNRLRSKAAIFVGGVVLVGAGIFVGILMGDSVDADSTDEAGNTQTTAEFVAPDNTDVLAPSEDGEGTTVVAAETQQNGNTEYLPITKLVERSRFAEAQELVVASFDTPHDAYSAELIANDWAYKLGLYMNVGYGDEEHAKIFYDDASLTQKNKIIDYSDDLGDYRYLSEHMERWDSFGFSVTNFELISKDKFTVEGTFTQESNENGTNDEESGTFYFKRSEFEIYDVNFIGWRVTHTE